MSVPVLIALNMVRATTVSSRFGVRVTSRNAASPGRSITVAIVLTFDIFTSLWLGVVFIWLYYTTQTGNVKSNRSRIQ